MANRISRSLMCAALLLSVCSAFSFAATDARGLLSSLATSVNQNIVILDGSIKATPEVDHWQISLNDSIVFTSTTSASKSETQIRVALALRPGDNLICLESAVSAADADNPIHRWSRHVFRETDKKAEQFALLVQGEVSSPTDATHLQEFRSALVHTGLDPSHIMLAQSASDIDKELATLGNKTNVNDQVLIYYSGHGRLSKANTEPLLVFPPSDAQFNVVRASDLLHESADLPSTSVVLDIAYPSLRSPVEQSGQGSDRVPITASSQSAPWLQSLSSQSKVELAYTNPSNPGSGSLTGGFTADLIAELAAPTSEPAPCRRFADIIQAVATANTHKQAGTRPVYFTQNPASTSFCFSKTTEGQQIISFELTQVKADPSFILADVRAKIPAGANASWADVIVDGVLVTHRPVLPPFGDGEAAAFAARIPVDPGRHLVEIKAGRGNNSALVASEVVEVPGNISLESRSSSKLRASIEAGASENVTSDPSVNVGFVVGDLDGNSVQYEIRNNGVSILRDVIHNTPTLQRVEVVRNVPLGIGANSIVVEVKHADQFSATTNVVLRRPAQPVRAVLIGVDAPAGLPALIGASADARTMKDLVLRYTEAGPSEVTLLTGAAATRQAITSAIANSTNSHPADPFSAPDGGDETLLLYFAGYGASIKNADTLQVTRCILPADFDVKQPEKSCLSTTEIDDLLDSSPRAVVIFDTSYDGLSGKQNVKFGDGGNVFSRTYNDFFTGDATWRLSAGTDRSDRVFLVASGTNSPALEFGSLGHGLFTSALVKSIADQLVSSSSTVKTAPSVSLFDAYNRARLETLSRSNNLQDPVMKGVLSTQFQFAGKSPLDLKREASAISRAIHGDVVSMRSVNPLQLRRATKLYTKVLSVNQVDVEALQGQARLLLYQSNLSTAAQLIDAGIASQPTPQDPRDDSEWLLIRSELKMRQGDLDGAIVDCQRALQEYPSSLRSKAQLGMLYASTLQYEKSFQVFQGILDNYPTASSDHTFTEEEWGELVLLSYLSLRRTGNRADANLVLRSYSESYAGYNALKHVVSNFVFRKLYPHQTHLVSIGDVTVQSPWSHVVSEFMLDPKRHEAELRSFWNVTTVYDPKNEKQFNCMLHFYLGMARLVGKSPAEARQEFQVALDTGQSEYAEYWMARAEVLHLSQQSKRRAGRTMLDQVASR
jgi:tetratricopeptide (TPR) repeat protein